MGIFNISIIMDVGRAAIKKFRHNRLIKKLLFNWLFHKKGQIKNWHLHSYNRKIELPTHYDHLYFSIISLELLSHNYNTKILSFYHEYWKHRVPDITRFFALTASAWKYILFPSRHMLVFNASPGSNGFTNRTYIKFKNKTNEKSY